MEDAEAEALLLMPGAWLSWKPRKTLRGLFPSLAEEMARSGKGEYRVLGHKTLRFRHVYKASHRAYLTNHYLSDQEVAGYDVDRCPRDYKNLTEAKDACERHHLTGKWE